MDELARVFVTLFDAKHLLSPLLWNMFYREVEVSDCMQTLFRGNSLGSKIMAFCFKIYGATFLQGLLEPLIQDMETVSVQPEPTTTTSKRRKTEGGKLRSVAATSVNLREKTITIEDTPQGVFNGLLVLLRKITNSN